MFLFEKFQLGDGRECKLILPETKYAEEMYNIIDNERERLGEYLPWVHNLKSAEEEKKVIEDILQQMLDKKMFVLMILVDDKVAGMIDLHEIKINVRAEVGYWLSREYEGLGIITRSVEYLTEYAFTELNLHKLTILVQTENAKSAAIPKRLNFIKEGVLVEHEMSNGKFVSLDLYSKINS